MLVGFGENGRVVEEIRLAAGHVGREAVVAIGDLRREVKIFGHAPEVVRRHEVRTVETTAVAVDSPQAVRGHVDMLLESRFGTLAVDEQRGLTRHVATRVVRLQRVQRLRFPLKTHQRQLSLPKERTRADGRLGCPHPARLGVLLQPDIDGRVLRKRDVLQRFHRLVVLHHLHATHVAGMDIVRRYAVSALQHVLTLDVELVDRLSVVGDGPALLDFNAWHLFEDVAQRAVGRCRKSGDDIRDGVPPFVNAGSADDDLPQRCGLFFKGHVVRRPTFLDRERACGVAHHRKVEHAIGRVGRQRHFKPSVSHRLRERQHFLRSGRAHRDKHTRYGLAVSAVGHRSR